MKLFITTVPVGIKGFRQVFSLNDKSQLSNIYYEASRSNTLPVQRYIIQQLA